MATTISATDFAGRVQKLLDDRQQHIDAIAQINQMLAGVGAALGGAVKIANGRTTSASVVAAPAAAPHTRKRRRGRGSFAVNAEESILTFVKQNKKPTTQDINKHFKDEGRSSTADNALSKLVREGQLKRTPLGKGIRGSHYSLA